MPGNDEPAEQESEPAIPQVPSIPDLPLPPDIKYIRPDRGRPYGGDSSGKSTDASHSGRSSREAGGIPTGAGLSAGITFAASIIVGVLIGQFVDKKLGFSQGGVPWGTIVFFFAGLAAGFINLFRLLTIYDNKNQK